jgi:hypothetical protein
MSNTKPFANTFTALPLFALLGCGSDVIDLGGGTAAQSLSVAPRCDDSGIFYAPVVVTAQAELNALTGCKEIRDDLTIQVFEGADLSPLASLREVNGTLTLGAEAPLADDPEGSLASYEAILQSGWLSSLHGVEAIEHVGSLTLQGITASDLTAFQSLRNISTHNDATLAGQLQIFNARNLVDLSGLENVAGIRSISVAQNPLLTSLDGLHLFGAIDAIGLSDNPLLSDLGALAELSAVSQSISIKNTAIRNLDGLIHVSVPWSVDIIDNPELTDASTLEEVGFQSLTIQGNPKLVSLPNFVNGATFERLAIIGNAELRTVFLNFFTAYANTEVQGTPLRIGKAWIEIGDNPKLQTIGLHDNGVDDVTFGITSGQVFAAHGNASLTDIDLGSLRRLDLLSIVDNPTLSRVGIGNLETADIISVVDNPELATAELQTVRSFESTFTGNVD